MTADRPFTAGAKAETRQRDWNALRDAIRNHADHEEIERLWDRCERWVVTIPEDTSSEESRLRQILLAIEIMTATGHGLTPEETIEVHIIAAEGRSDDPHAWRADPEAIQRLRDALHGVTITTPAQDARAMTMIADALNDLLIARLGVVRPTAEAFYDGKRGKFTAESVGAALRKIGGEG